MSVTSLINPFPYSAGSVPQEMQAFPLGWGSTANGGAGGTIIRVTTGANAGAGSLREALLQTGARIILFDVRTITLTSSIDVGATQGNFTMYGQSAGGVQVVMGAGWSSGDTALIKIRAGDWIMQGMMLRPGDVGGVQTEALSPGGGSGTVVSNVVIDHCSLLWGTDEVLDFVGGLDDSTVSNCIIGQGLSNSVHAEGEHSKGLNFFISGGAHVSTTTFVYNLVPYNVDRNPWMGFTLGNEYINNYHYGMGCKNGRMGQFARNVSDRGNNYCTAAILGNVWEKSSESGATTTGLTLSNQGVACDWYIDDNLFLTAAGANFTPQWTGDGGTNVSTTTSPFTMSGIEDVLLSSSEVREYVLANAGPRHTDRDVVDAAIVALVTARSPGIIDSQSEMGGYPTFETFTPYTDTDGDGIPDAFEGSFSDLDEFMQYLIYNPLPTSGSVAGDTLTLAAGSRTRTGHQATFSLAGGAEATPVIESKTSVTTNSTATNRDIAKPAGVAVGDMILIFGNVESVAGNWNTPTGDTFLPVFTPFTADSNIIGAWYRIADGGEPASFNCSITSGTGENMVLSCWRVSGVNGADPFNFVNTPAGSGGNATSHAITGNTTDADNCLAVAFLGGDGGDMSPYSSAGTGWAEEDDLTQNAADAGRQSMSISIKDQSSAGATGTCTVTSTASDGSAFVQFAINPG